MAAAEPTAQTGKRLIAVRHVPMLTDGYVHIRLTDEEAAKPGAKFFNHLKEKEEGDSSPTYRSGSIFAAIR